LKTSERNSGRLFTKQKMSVGYS